MAVVMGGSMKCREEVGVNMVDHGGGKSRMERRKVAGTVAAWAMASGATAWAGEEEGGTGCSGDDNGRIVMD